jgi:DNA-binding CsgD family transcriptional regulator
MITDVAMPWKKLYDFLLACGNKHERKAFSVEILHGLKEWGLCDFDQSLVYFLDGNGKVCNQHLMDIDKQWSTLYLEYYAKMESGYYHSAKTLREHPNQAMIHVRTWKNEPASEFLSNYIRTRGLKYSLGFVLFDLNGKPRTLFALDKIKDANFTDGELATLELVVPLLNNLHKNFFSQQSNRQEMDQITWATSNLTPREIEVAQLLCQGVSPAAISSTLCISQATTNKHIAHLYEKLHVSNRQELLVRLLSD